MKHVADTLSQVYVYPSKCQKHVLMCVCEPPVSLLISTPEVSSRCWLSFTIAGCTVAAIRMSDNSQQKKTHPLMNKSLKALAANAWAAELLEWQVISKIYISAFDSSL